MYNGMYNGQSLRVMRGIHLQHVRRKVCGLNLQADSGYIADYKSRGKSSPGGTERDIRSHSRIHRIFFRSRSIPHLARSHCLPLSIVIYVTALPFLYFHLLCWRDLFALTCADLVMFSKIFQASSYPIRYKFHGNQL